MIPEIDITLLITTFNRGSLLRNSLNRLSHLTLPDQILVVDDGSTDDTEQVCAHLAQFLPITYIYNHSPEPTICSMARNIGLRHARNDWVVTSEPELMYCTDILEQFSDLHEHYPNEIISAGTIHFAPPTWSAAEAVEWGPTGDGFKPPAGAQEAIGWVAPYTGLWYRPWLEELGGWDEDFPGCWGWDDIDLLTRLRINGHGQHIALPCKAVHQFHGLGGDKDFINEAHFYKKSFTHGQENHKCSEACPGESEHRLDIVANRGREWGKITKRS